MGLSALQSLAWLVGLRAVAMGAQMKFPEPTLLFHEAGALLVQISPLFVRNAIPGLFGRHQACLPGRGGDTCFRHNAWIYYFPPPRLFAFYRPQIKGSGPGAAAVKTQSHWRSVFLKKWGIAACSKTWVA